MLELTVPEWVDALIAEVLGESADSEELGKVPPWVEASRVWGEYLEASEARE
jgi:hypothetical protein